MPSISSIISTATLVGVPPTAAEGCSAAASSSTVAPTVPSWAPVWCSCATPVTSVARCITLGRCSTNGTSGTLVEEQYGASDSATERTAYSCSSRSFEERASWPARAASRCVVAGTPDGAGQHPRGDQAALAPDEQLGRRAEEPVDVEGPAHLVVLGQPRAAASGRRCRRRRWRPGRGRARPSPARRRRSARPPARPRTPTPHRSSRRRRSGRCAGAWGSGWGDQVGERGELVGADHGDPATGHRGCRRRRAGRRARCRPARRRRRSCPGRSGRCPGTSTSSRTTAAPDTARHQSPASAKRSVPEVRQLAATPQATMPSPRRSHAIGWSVGSRSSRFSGSTPPAVTSTVRATRRPGAGSRGVRAGHASSVRGDPRSPLDEAQDQ